MIIFKQKVLKEYIEGIEVLYEDREILVVNKPAGLSTESGKQQHPSVEKILYDYFQALDTSKIFYLRAIQRLDRPVSAVLVLAKKKEALSRIMLLFEQRAIQKTYTAVVSPPPANQAGQLTHYLRRDDSGRKAIRAESNQKGAVKCTLEYEVVSKHPKGVMLRIRPLERRFHQIRAQLAAAGMPVVRDTLYGAMPLKDPNMILLHAESVKMPDGSVAKDAVLECMAGW